MAPVVLAISNRGFNTRYCLIQNGYLEIKAHGTHTQIKVSWGNQSWTTWADSVVVQNTYPSGADLEEIKFPLQ